MAKYNIMYAVEHNKLGAATKKKYPTPQSLVDAGWWVQKKYDGCFGMAVMSMDGSRMLSRTGEDYSLSCAHLLRALYAGASVHGPFDDFVVLGEVWHPEWKFPDISGVMRRQRSDEESAQLHFIINDILPEGLETSTKYRHRLEDANTFAVDCESPVITTAVSYLTSTDWLDDRIDVVKAAQAWKDAGGYDGAILRDPDAGYTIGTALKGQIVKVKPSLSYDLMCVGQEEGLGKHAGKMGAIHVRYKDGKIVKVGTGFTDSERLMEFEGSIVEIEAMGESKDGSLREPRFKGIRIDKLQPDF